VHCELGDVKVYAKGIMEILDFLLQALKIRIVDMYIDIIGLFSGFDCGKSLDVSCAV
jgi:hypothetical protein